MQLHFSKRNKIILIVISSILIIALVFTTVYLLLTRNVSNSNQAAIGIAYLKIQPSNADYTQVFVIPTDKAYTLNELGGITAVFGKIQQGSGDYNVRQLGSSTLQTSFWSWSLDPSSIVINPSSDLMDKCFKGLPQDIEANVASFTQNTTYYCPTGIVVGYYATQPVELTGSTTPTAPYTSTTTAAPYTGTPSVSPTTTTAAPYTGSPSATTFTFTPTPTRPSTTSTTYPPYTGSPSVTTTVPAGGYACLNMTIYKNGLPLTPGTQVQGGDVLSMNVLINSALPNSQTQAGFIANVYPLTGTTLSEDVSQRVTSSYYALGTANYTFSYTVPRTLSYTGLLQLRAFYQDAYKNNSYSSSCSNYLVIAYSK